MTTDKTLTPSGYVFGAQCQQNIAEQFDFSVFVFIGRATGENVELFVIIIDRLAGRKALLADRMTATAKRAVRYFGYLRRRRVGFCRVRTVSKAQDNAHNNDNSQQNQRSGHASPVSTGSTRNPAAARSSQNEG